MTIFPSHHLYNRKKGGRSRRPREGRGPSEVTSVTLRMGSDLGPRNSTPVLSPAPRLQARSLAAPSSLAVPSRISFQCVRNRSTGFCGSTTASNCYFFLFIYFWLSWVFFAACRLSRVAASGGHSSLRCAGFSLRWPLLLRSTDSRHVGFSSCGSRALECRLSSCGSRA